MFNFKFEAVVNGLDMDVALNGVRYEEDGLIWDNEMVEVFNEEVELVASLDGDELFSQHGICIASDLEDQMTQAGIWKALEKAENKANADY